MPEASAMPCTWTGVGETVLTSAKSEDSVSPLPSCPYSLSPQHEIVPPSRRAQACSSPAEMLIAGELSIGVGVLGGGGWIVAIGTTVGGIVVGTVVVTEEAESR